VVRAKTSRGERFAILDGGIHHLLRPALTGEPFPVRAASCAAGDDRPRPTTLAGPLCTGLDRLGRAPLPPLAAGDLVGFGMAGAYGATESMSRFLSHPPAREICLEEHELPGRTDREPA
jgi:diaminopimelate decarboxylase